MGTQFDASVVNTFVSIMNSREEEIILQAGYSLNLTAASLCAPLQTQPESSSQFYASGNAPSHVL